MLSHDPFPECEGFFGRKRSICRGEIKTLEEVNKHRVNLWGLPPLGVERIPEPTGLKPSPRIFTGPGDCLREIISQLGLGTAWCEGCVGRAKQMNVWGVDGCRKNFDTIVGWMNEQYRGVTWGQWSLAATKALSSGLIFSLNLLDPCRSIVEEALRRSEERSNFNNPESPPP